MSTLARSRKIRSLIQSWSLGAEVDMDKLTRMTNRAYKMAASESEQDTICAARAGISEAIEAGRAIRAERLMAESKSLGIIIKGENRKTNSWR